MNVVGAGEGGAATALKPVICSAQGVAEVGTDQIESHHIVADVFNDCRGVCTKTMRRIFLSHDLNCPVVRCTL